MVMLWWMWKHGCYMLTTFSIVSKEEYKQTRHSCQRSNSNWGFNSYNFAFWYRFEWSFVSPLSLLSFLSWSIGSVAFSDLQLLPVFHRCHFRPWDLAVHDSRTKSWFPSFDAIYPVWDRIINTFLVEHAFVNQATNNDFMYPSRVV